MPYKYVETTKEDKEIAQRPKPVITETKEIKKPELTPEEQYEKDQTPFFDEDDDITEVVWD